MNLTLWKKRDPFSSLSPLNGGMARLHDEMDRTLERFFSEPFGLAEPKALRAESWAPPIDVSETETEILIRGETPGIPAKDLEISVSGRTLSISGKKEEQEEKKGEDFYRCERRFGSFRRVIDLPETADPDKVSAESDNGVFTVHVAKKPSAKPKQVEIKPAGKKVDVAGPRIP